MFFLLLNLIGPLCTSFKLKCPEPPQWSPRAKGVCGADQSKYFCLENELTGGYSENCSKTDYDRGGKKIILRGGFDQDDCSPDRYQPLNIYFWTNVSTGCLYQKSTCSEEGQVIISNGSSTTDVNCICDYTRGYSYISTPRNICSCIPSEEDCSCYIKKCHQSTFILSPEYKCINKEKDFSAMRCCVQLKYNEQNVSVVSVDKKETEINEFSGVVDETDQLKTIVGALTVLILALCIVLAFCGLKIDAALNRYVYKGYIVSRKDTEITIDEGESVTVSYQLSKGKMTVYWYKDGGWIHQTEMSNYKTMSDGCLYKLIIENASLKDAGDYKMKLASAISPVTKVNINPIFKSDMESVTCIEGDDVCLSCEVKNELMMATWYKDCSEIPNMDMKQRAGLKRTLKIDNTSIDESGRYRVKVGKAFRDANLTVKPFIRKKIEDCLIMEYLPITLKCVAEKSGLKPKWTKDGKYLPSSDRIKTEESNGGEYSLTISETKLTDSGKYTIFLNGHSSEAEIKIKAIPEEIKRMPEDERKRFIAAAAKDGTVPRYCFRVMIVGQNGVGKTCLLRRIRKKDINDVKSTDGIDIEFSRCQIDLKTGEWIFSEEKISSLDLRESEVADCRFWDFAGQKVYYLTHQTFLTQNAIYLLTVSLKEMFEKESHSRDIRNKISCEEIENLLCPWLDNIHCFAQETYEQAADNNDGATKLFPPVILFVTGIDVFQNCDDVKTKFHKELDKYLKKNIKRGHLHGIYFVSNINPDLNDFEKLKQNIYEVAQTMPIWAEGLPTRWSLLEKQMLQRRTKQNSVLSYNDAVELSKACRFEGTDDLDLFLKYEHEIGNIIYFDSIDEYIILDPMWLVKAFKCLVADEQFCEKSLNVHKEEMRTTGKLSEELIKLMFEKEPYLDFKNRKGLILKIMEKFDIIVLLPLRDGINEYYMPCMITETSFEDIISNYTAQSKIHCKTSWLFVEFSFMPPTFFNHILVNYIRKYSISVNTEGTPALGQGIGVFKLTPSGCQELLVVASKNSIVLQILEWNERESGEAYEMIRRELISEVNKVAKRYRLKITYEIKLKCHNGKHSTPVGRKSIDFRHEPYKCEEHNEVHNKYDIMKYWFQDKGVREKGRLNDITDTTTAEKICDLCIEPWKDLCHTCDLLMCRNCSANHREIQKNSNHVIQEIMVENILKKSYQIPGIVIYDIKVLPSGLLVIAPRHAEKLLTCKIGAEQQNTIHIKGEPQDIAVIDNSRVAVALYQESKILIVYIETRQIEEIDVKHEIESIMCTNNQIFVGCGEDRKIDVFSLSGLLVKTIRLSEIPYVLCGVGEQRICYACMNKIYCIDSDGKNIFTFPFCETEKPWSMTTDDDGNILAVCKDSGNVRLISPDGRKSRILLANLPASESHPYICYDSNLKSVFIGLEDYVHVFKLLNCHDKL